MKSNTMTDNPDNSENSENEDHIGFRIKIMTTGCNVEEVLAEPTPYFHGDKKKVVPILAIFLETFQTMENASTHFTTVGACDAYEHITRQHVRDIMNAYGRHLKANDNASKTFTFGDEFKRILRNIASTMESWK